MSAAPPSVLFVAGTLGMGGAERQLSYWVADLRRRGAEVAVASFRAGEWYEERLRALGAKVFAVGDSRWAIPQLTRILRSLGAHRPQILHSVHFYVNPYVMAAARWSGAAEIGSIHSAVDRELGKLPGPLGAMTLRGCRLLTVNHAAALDRAAERGARMERLYYLPNAVDTEVFRPPQRLSTATAAPLHIVAIGRLVRVKRFDLLLAALERFRGRQGVRVTLVGDGPLRDEILADAAARRLYPGLLDYQPLIANPAEIYRTASVVVLSSDAEGLPNVALEAMASGVPVVATDVGGTSEAVRAGETGRLVRAGDAEALGDVIEELLESPARRLEMGGRGRELAESHYSRAALSERLDALYRRAAGPS